MALEVAAGGGWWPAGSEEWPVASVPFGLPCHKRSIIHRAFKCKQSHVNTYKGDDVFLLFMENRIALNYFFFFLWTSLKVVISKRVFSFLTYMSTGTCVRDGNY